MYSLKFYLVTVLILVSIFKFCNGRKESVIGIPKRSERWDNYVQSLRDGHQSRRVRRQADAMEWEAYSFYCNPDEYTAYDALGRRDSGMLATPQSQGSCGNCWAFASVHALTDHLNLNAEANTTIPLWSATHLTSCNKDPTLVGEGNGCCGSRVLEAGLKFFRSHGAVTADCSPYTQFLATYGDEFEKNGDEGGNPPVPPTCPRNCTDGSDLDLRMFDNFGFQQLNSDQEIIDALDSDSVVLAGMVVNDEFSDIYECGIYHPPADLDPESEDLGGHAVVIVDYGTSPMGTDFWVVKNSWGEYAHENGFFRIVRGGLYIGRMGWAFRLMPESSLQDSSEFGSCMVITIGNVTTNVRVIAAAEFVRDQLIAMDAIECIDGPMGEGLILDTIMSAEIQIVAGANIEVEFSADILGCEQPTTIYVNGGVTVDPEGNFTLNYYTIVTIQGGGAGGLAAIGWLLMLLAAILVIATVQ